MKKVFFILFVSMFFIFGCNNGDDQALPKIPKVNKPFNLNHSENTSNVDDAAKSNPSENASQKEEFDSNTSENTTKIEDKIKQSPSETTLPKEESYTEKGNNILVNNHNEALEYLKMQLLEGNNDDLSFGVDDKVYEDDKGSYYVVQLVSVSTRASGKTGTLGYYKVYSDGFFEKN